MMSDYRDGQLIINADVRACFQDLVASALAHQKVEAEDETVYYIVNLLTSFTRSEDLYEQTPDGLMIKPLASLYLDALEAPSGEDRNKALQRLGDIALFIAGVFTDSLNRQLVDVDYYISMGGNAYGYLSDRARDTIRWRVFGNIFGELSSKFTDFVDVLGEVSEKAHFTTHADILRLYELWIRTGSKRAARRLKKLGIQTIEASISRRHH